MTDSMRPGAHELWRQAGGGTEQFDEAEYHRLMVAEGLMEDNDESKQEAGWTPDR